MTQYRHLYWDSGNADLRMFSDSELEVLSYFLRKRYAALLDSTNTTPGHVGLSQPNGADDVTIGTAINGVRGVKDLTQNLMIILLAVEQNQTQTSVVIKQL